MVSLGVKCNLKAYFTIFVLSIMAAGHNSEATGKIFQRSTHIDYSDSEDDCERTKRSLNAARCTDRPEGCFCNERDDSCHSCNGIGCCMCDEYCLTANDCCHDFTLYCTKGCDEISCQNGGVCQQLNNRFTRCDCQNDFTGSFCEKNLCKPFPSDIVFVMDTSSSIKDAHINDMIQFLKSMPENMTIGHDQTQVALVTVSGNTDIVHPFDSVVNRDDFHNKLTLLAFSSSRDQSELVDGINTAKQLLTQRFHLQRNRFIVILTDGLITTPNRLEYGYNPFFPVFAVAVGEDVSHYFLSKMTTGPDGIFSMATDRLWHRIYSETLDTRCNVCSESSKTDLVIAVDVSVSGVLDERKTLPSIFNKLFQHIETKANDTNIAVLHFGKDIIWRFGFSKIIPGNKEELKLKSYYVADSRLGESSNFTNLFMNIASPFEDVTKGGRQDAKKEILILSRFEKSIEEKAKGLAKDFHKDGIQLHTIGNDNSLEIMSSITPSAFNVGILGNDIHVMDSVDSFLDVFVGHLSYTQCIWYI